MNVFRVSGGWSACCVLSASWRCDAASCCTERRERPPLFVLLECPVWLATLHPKVEARLPPTFLLPHVDHNGQLVLALIRNSCHCRGSSGNAIQRMAAQCNGFRQDHLDTKARCAALLPAPGSFLAHDGARDREGQRAPHDPPQLQCCCSPLPVKSGSTSTSLRARSRSMCDSWQSLASAMSDASTSGREIEHRIVKVRIWLSFLLHFDILPSAHDCNIASRCAPRAILQVLLRNF